MLTATPQATKPIANTAIPATVAVVVAPVALTGLDDTVYCVPFASVTEIVLLAKETLAPTALAAIVILVLILLI